MGEFEALGQCERGSLLYLGKEKYEAQAVKGYEVHI